MDNNRINKEDELKKVNGGADTNAQTPSAEGLRQAAEAMLRQAGDNAGKNPLDLLNGPM